MREKSPTIRSVQRPSIQNGAASPLVLSEHASDTSSLCTMPLSGKKSTGVSSTPVTLPRGRSMTRYPESLARVPLHRRGTSRTYERLEDLLREAGYKETRIFTPEAERTVESSGEKHEGRASSSVRGGVRAVFGFLSGFVSRNSSPVRGETTSADTTAACSPPPSPLPQVRQLNGSTNVSYSASPAQYSQNASSESLHVTVQRMRISSALGSADTTHPPLPAKSVHNVVQSRQALRGTPHYLNLPIPQQRPSNHRQSSKPARSDESTAHAYLRHMASAPNIHPVNKRPSSSAISLRSQQPPLPPAHPHDRGTQCSRHVINLNDHPTDYECKLEVSAQDAQMPASRNWLESVTKALLPAPSAAVVSDTASAKTVATRTSNSAISDCSQPRGRQLTKKPSLLSSQIQDQKAKVCKGQVQCATVLCRSAPTSRASSLVRTIVVDGKAQSKSIKPNQPAKAREDRSSLRSRKAKRRPKDVDIIPSLAKTQVENESRYLGGWNMDAHGDGLSSDDDDDDDDDELGLDRLLVPARRQHSIQSLRKHLHRPTGEAASNMALGSKNGRSSPFGAARSRRNRQNGSWGRGREWTSEQDDDGEEGYTSVFTSSKFGTTGRNSRRRQGLPGAWARWGTAS